MLQQNGSQPLRVSTESLSTAGGRSLKPEHRDDLASSGLDERAISLSRCYSDSRGLVFPYLEPSGKPYTCSDGQPFERWKQFSRLPRYLSPSGNGCRLYHSPVAIAREDYPARLQSTKEPLRLTEGEKKTLAGSVKLSGVTIGLGGVSSWVDHRQGNEASDPLPELDAISIEYRAVRLAFDSDLATKPAVIAELQKLALYIDSRSGYPQIVRLPNELDGSKNGLDDFIARHGVAAYEALERVAQCEPIFKTNNKGEKSFSFSSEPVESHVKAVMAWAVLKERFAARPGVGLYEWQGTYWKQIGSKVDAVLAPVLHQFMDEQEWQKRSAHLFKSVLAEVAARLEVPEQHWNPSHLIGFSNGVLDIKTDTFRPHQRGDYLVHSRPFDWQPAALCPNWIRFSDQAMSGNAELVRLLQAVFRYVLSPKDRNKPFRIEKCFDFIGAKGTGKGTTLEVLQGLLGESGISLIKPKTFTDAESLAALLDCVVGLDMDSSGHMPDCGLFNSVISNEALNVRQLYQPVLRNVRLGVVIVRAYNNIPSVGRAGSEGLDRRIIAIPFKHRPEQPDEGLKARLLGELPGIYQWAWQMPLAEAEQIILGSGAIAAIAEASVERHMDNNPITRFMVEAFQDGCAAIGALELFEQWCDWCKRRNHEAGSQTSFGTAVSKLSSLVSKTRNSTGNYVYKIMPSRDFDIPEHLGIKPFRTVQSPSGTVQSSEQLDEPEAGNPSDPSEPFRAQNPVADLGLNSLNGLNGYLETIKIEAEAKESVSSEYQKPVENGQKEKNLLEVLEMPLNPSDRSDEPENPSSAASTAEWVSWAIALLDQQGKRPFPSEIRILLQPSGCSKGQVNAELIRRGLMPG